MQEMKALNSLHINTVWAVSCPLIEWLDTVEYIYKDLGQAEWMHMLIGWLKALFLHIR